MTPHKPFQCSFGGWRERVGETSITPVRFGDLDLNSDLRDSCLFALQNAYSSRRGIAGGG